MSMTSAVVIAILEEDSKNRVRNYIGDYKLYNRKVEDHSIYTITECDSTLYHMSRDLMNYQLSNSFVMLNAHICTRTLYEFLNDCGDDGLVYIDFAIVFSDYGCTDDGLSPADVDGIGKVLSTHLGDGLNYRIIYMRNLGNMDIELL